jgi:hypothetical protein
MKKIFTLVNCALLLTILLGADIRTTDGQHLPSPPKKPCSGYTIVEFGKGVDCNGDTVKLTKLPGGTQVLARE